MKPRFNLIHKFFKVPEMRTTKSGKLMATFGVPVSSSKESPTFWINCMAMGTLAERLEHIEKDDEFYIAGDISENAYTRRDGSEVLTIQVWLDTVRSCMARPEWDNPGQQQSGWQDDTAKPEPAVKDWDTGKPVSDFPPIEDDDIPF